jgi:hypothetical protein
MKITVALAATVSLCACDGSGSASPQEPANVTSVCQLATDGGILDGRLVRFRSGFDVAVEHVRVVDSKCPQIMVFLHHAADSNVDLTLCSEPNSRFGCPVSPDFKVKATFTGVFHASKTGGVVDVISMAEVSGEGGGM